MEKLKRGDKTIIESFKGYKNVHPDIIMNAIICCVGVDVNNIIGEQLLNIERKSRMNVLTDGTNQFVLLISVNKIYTIYLLNKNL